MRAKFVPASGAASRMFKSLIGYMHGCEGNRDDIAEDGQRLDVLLETGDHATILKYILSDTGLNYAN